MKPSLLLAIFVLAFAGCRQDMYNQPRYKPYAADDFFSNGSSARPIPPHTVSREDIGQSPEFSTGKTVDGKLVEAFPFQITAAVLARGQERFNIYCAVCHGRTGDGNGMIVQRGFPPPPSYHIDRLRNAPVGHFFDVMTNGYGVMYSYAPSVTAEDRWAIAAYIRALQLSHHATLAAVPPQDQSKLPK